MTLLKYVPGVRPCCPVATMKMNDAINQMDTEQIINVNSYLASSLILKITYGNAGAVD